MITIKRNGLHDLVVDYDTLAGADLHGAYLAGAYLAGANLRCADLRDATLRGAYLACANLMGAILDGANLAGAYLACANLKGAILGNNSVPFDQSIKRQILDQVTAHPETLDMRSWHTCDTTHCLAGWAVMFHPQGKQLKDKTSTAFAGRVILNLLGPGEDKVFYTSKKEAIEWLKSK
jgi:hypothetical protein